MFFINTPIGQMFRGVVENMMRGGVQGMNNQMMNMNTMQDPMQNLMNQVGNLNFGNQNYMPTQQPMQSFTQQSQNTFVPPQQTSYTNQPFNDSKTIYRYKQCQIDLIIKYVY